jgi:hypothetical protein
MISFADGPARGQVLSLSRAPKLLRVVECGGKWDALDQIDDEPEMLETIYVYRIDPASVGRGHVSLRGKGGRREGRWFIMATYHFIEEQPDDADMRDNAKWRDWTTEYAKTHFI